MCLTQRFLSSLFTFVLGNAALELRAEEKNNWKNLRTLEGEPSKCLHIFEGELSRQTIYCVQRGQGLFG